MAQDHPLDSDILELDRAATPIQPTTPVKEGKISTPDLASERARVFEVDVLCCNFNTVLGELVQWEEVESRRGDYDLCSGRAQSPVWHTHIK